MSAGSSSYFFFDLEVLFPVGPIQYIVYLFPVLTAAALFYFFAWYVQTQRAPLAQQLDPAPVKRRLSFSAPCHPMVKRDAIAALIITAVYAVTAFAHLGDLEAPQSYRDFGDWKAQTFVLPEEVQLLPLLLSPLPLSSPLLLFLCDCCCVFLLLLLLVVLWPLPLLLLLLL